MTAAIYYVGGSKGGVGKSMISMALIDLLEQRGEKILLVETDTANPDVAKAYQHLNPAVLNLDRQDGWMDLIDALEAHPGHTAVIQTAARANLGVEQYGSTLVAAQAELKRKLVALWPINRKRDCLELCTDFREAMPNMLVHIIRNNHYGSAEKFEFYNSSLLMQAVEASGGKTLDFPDLADRVSDYLNVNRLTIADARPALKMSSRIELDRWRGEARKMFEEILV